ncbi:MAG: type II secretion system protein [Bacteroidota bacterium]
MRRGFSLIELLVSLALISLFATMVLPLAELAVKRNQEADLRTALRHVRDALDAYKQAADEGRVTVRPGDSGYPRTLGILVDGVSDNKSPEKTTIYFLRSIPRDPFAAPDIKAEDTWGKRSYKSPHDRPQAGDDVFDIYSLSPESGINGIPYAEW